MVLSDATETIFYVDENTNEILTKKKQTEMVFIRGDSVILVSDAATV